MALWLAATATSTSACPGSGVDGIGLAVLMIIFFILVLESHMPKRFGTMLLEWFGKQIWRFSSPLIFLSC
jgi:hypothetical protein